MADVVDLAEAVKTELAAFAWGETATVTRGWLQVKDLKALATLTILVAADADIASAYQHAKDRHEIALQIVVQKRVGKGDDAPALVDALVAKIAAARDALRKSVAGMWPLAPEWPVIASPEHLHEFGLLFSVLVMRWVKL